MPICQASFLGCDILMNPDRIPPLVKDYYWDKQDCPIPYTEAAMQFKKKTYRGSADDMKLVLLKARLLLQAMTTAWLTPAPPGCPRTSATWCCPRLRRSRRTRQSFP